MSRFATIDPAKCAQRLAALGNEKRWTVVQQLAAGELCVCQLTDAIDAPQPLLSFHLRVLKEAGVVTDRREGRWVYYRLVPGVLDEMIDDLAEVRDTAPRGSSPRC